MLYLAYAALLASVASAASIPNVAPNHLKVDFSVLRGDSRSTATRGGNAKIVASDDYAYLYLANAQKYYQSNLKIGSNGDENGVLVDTGSSDLWLMASNVACYSQTGSQKRSIDEFPTFAHHRLIDFENEEPTGNIAKRSYNTTSATSGTYIAPSPTETPSPSFVSVNPSTCTSLGSFNTGSSSSFKLNSTAPAFSIVYGDGTFAKGIWGTDYVSVGALNVSDVSIAIVNDTTSEFGVFGIGLSRLEVTFADATDVNAYQYENFPIRLKSTGVINKVAYSLYLNSPDAASGSVLFGAVDHSKYYGQLQTVPVLNIYPKYFKKPISFDVACDSVTLGDSKQNISIYNQTFPALLDSGTTLTYLPTPLVNSIAKSLNATFNSTVGYYQISCAYNTSSAFLSYNLSGIEIKSPLSDLVLSDDTTPNCYLGVVGSSADEPEAIFGDSFLRHAYVVYNLEDFEISLAPVKYSDEEDIDVIYSTVPSAIQAPGYSATSFVSSVVGYAPTAVLSLPVDSTTSVVSSSTVYSSASVVTSTGYSSSPVIASASYSASSVVSSLPASLSTSVSVSAASNSVGAAASSASVYSSEGVSSVGSVPSISTVGISGLSSVEGSETSSVSATSSGSGAAISSGADAVSSGSEALSTATVTHIVGTTVITITSCSDHKCTTTAVPATQGPTTVTTNGETTVYTTWCPLTSAAASSASVSSSGANSADSTYTTSSTSDGVVVTGTVTSVVATTIITITSCSDHKCTQTAVPATQGPTTVTTNGETTVYTTWCPLTSVTAAGSVSTSALTGTTVITSTSTGANGIVTTYAVTSTGAQVGTGVNTGAGPSTVAAQSTAASSAASSGTPTVSAAFNGAGKVGASVAMFALPLAYFL